MMAAYRTIGTNHLGGQCRFQPSCSQYAVEALNTHAPHRALSLILRRLLRCRPGGPFGFDPVPPNACCGEHHHANA
ncbi:MAG: membrane protein insertion efficiency factor YidD [Bdellovibrionaceae bacterium]|nr:membrane protein insertion efficiency factor YidD [Pseudobdellovibrionaceae bacterium]